MRTVSIRILFIATAFLGLTACANDANPPAETEPFEVIPGTPAPIEPIELPDYSGLEEPQPPRLPELPVLPPEEEEDEQPDVIVAGYLDLEAVDTAWVTPERIDFEGLTHLFVGFADIEDDGTCTFDEPAGTTLDTIEELAPESLHVVLSVRTWTSDGLLDAADDEVVRERFLRTCTELVDAYAFDGIDLAFPQLVGARAVDDVDAPASPAAYSSLVAELGASLGSDAVVTVAPPAGMAISSLFDVAQLMEAVDFITVPAYDFEGDAAITTSLLAPLAEPVSVTPASRPRTVPDAVDELVEAGVPFGKMVLGVSFRGRVYGGVVAGGDHDGMYQEFISDEGTIGYGDVVARMDDPNAPIFRADEAANAAWAFDPDDALVATFEDGVSIAAKKVFAEGRGMAGMAAFDLTADGPELTLYRAMTGR